jgi:hypothetical protein
MKKDSSYSGASEPNYAVVIENDLSRCQLLDISKIPLPPNIKFRRYEPGRYIVLQKGVMPGDLSGRSLDFLLTKQRRWLPMFAFLKLPEQERYDVCVFSSAGEAIQQVERLGRRAIVDEERIARARDAEQRSTPAKKLDTPDPSARASDATLSQREE